MHLYVGSTNFIQFYNTTPGSIVLVDSNPIIKDRVINSERVIYGVYETIHCEPSSSLEEVLAAVKCKYQQLTWNIVNPDWLFEIYKNVDPHLRSHIKIFNKTLVIIHSEPFYKNVLFYAYYESDHAKTNLEFFNQYGMFCSQTKYILVVNSPECSVELSPLWTVIYRSNIGFDFGAWYDGLQSVDINQFQYFIFLNDTMRGPIGVKNWIPAFTELLNAKVKLSGVSINTLSHPWFTHNYKRKTLPHVQSMLMCTDRTGLDLIYPKIINDVMDTDKWTVVLTKEIATSLEILKHGFNISCILPTHQVNYQDSAILMADNLRNSDVWSSPETVIHPAESVFYKVKARGQKYDIEKWSEIHKLMFQE